MGVQYTLENKVNGKIVTFNFKYFERHNFDFWLEIKKHPSFANHTTDNLDLNRIQSLVTKLETSDIDIKKIEWYWNNKQQTKQFRLKYKNCFSSEFLEKLDALYSHYTDDYSLNEFVNWVQKEKQSFLTLLNLALSENSKIKVS